MSKYTKQKADSMNCQKKEVWSTPKYIFVRKKEVPTTPMKVIIKQTYLTTSSMEVSVNEIDEPVVIKSLAQSAMKKVEIGVVANDEVESSNLDSKYFQLRWCPLGLTKTQRRKLQRAHCNKTK